MQVFPTPELPIKNISRTISELSSGTPDILITKFLKTSSIKNENLITCLTVIVST